MRILIFSGTTEGKQLCRFLSAHRVPAEVFVATDYGEAVMEPLAGIIVHTGRLTVPEMTEHLSVGALVIDATHPYASVVTQNIREACAQAGAEYLRLLRPTQAADSVVTVADTQAAVQWLCEHSGKVLLTTGSKELDFYTKIPQYTERLFPRVLPTAEVLAKCTALGFSGASILAMQGPFSHEMNVALLKKTGAQILVTKDTGKSGGFAEKLSAAKEVGATVLMIARPLTETGRSLEEMKSYLAARLEIARTDAPRFPLFVSLAGKKVVVIGAGSIAARRISVLERFGAQIHVVSPDCAQQIDRSAIHWQEKTFTEDDIADAFLVIAATNNRAVNHAVFEACRKRKIPVSVADCAAESTFYFPAVCFGSQVTVGLVSDGSDHHAVSQTAKKIREMMDTQ